LFHGILIGAHDCLSDFIDLQEILRIETDGLRRKKVATTERKERWSDSTIGIARLTKRK